MENGGGLYLDLMKKCLTDTIYRHVEPEPWRPTRLLHRTLNRIVRGRGLQIVKAEIPHLDLDLRNNGKDWPSTAHTMIGLKRLDNLQSCAEDVIKRSIPGDFIETGVWRGGTTIFMRAVLKAYGVTDRFVWVADSFEGLPVPDAKQYPADAGDIHHTFGELAIPLSQVKENFDKYGLLDDQVKFLKGWFRDTLPSAPMKSLALIRLDGDMYESTMNSLVSLYPKLSRGGYLIVDDYGAVPGCRKALQDYRQTHGITEEIRRIDWTGVFWQRINGN